LHSEAYLNLRKKYGNVAVADTLVDLAELSEAREPKKDSVVALWSPCVGAQVPTLLVKQVV
jgi:hypothetical protein